MQLTGTDLSSYLRPSECQLRVYLKEHGEPEDEPSPYQAVILSLDKRHEAAYLATLGPVLDLRTGTLAGREQATQDALRRREPSILFHAVLRHVAIVAGQVCDIVGVPDFILVQPTSTVIRDCRIAKRINDDDNPAILRELELNGWLLEVVTGIAPTRLEVAAGDGTVVEVPYDGGAAAVAVLRGIVESRLLAAEPYEPVARRRCRDCCFRSRCWTLATSRKDVSLVGDIDRGLALTLHDLGVNSFDELLAAFDEATLGALQRPRGLRTQRVGAHATTILRHARSLATNSKLLLQTPAIPQSANYVMFDCEGLPPQLDELNKAYLWGLQAFGEKPGPYRGITGGFGTDGDLHGWEGFLRAASEIFETYGDIPFVHWHHYERVQVDTYINRFGPHPTADRVKANLLDLLAITRQSVVLPLSSYSLKVVEKYVGFERQSIEYGGEWSMAKYVEAIETDDEQTRSALMSQILDYNREDLEATWAVLKWLNRTVAQELVARETESLTMPLNRLAKRAGDLVTNEIEALRRAVDELPRTGTSAYKIPGCSPNDDDRYTEPRNLATIKSKLISAGVPFWDGPDYGKHLIFELDGNSINVLCVPTDSMAAMAATTALVTRLAEFPEFVAMLKVKRERYKIFRVIYAMLNGQDTTR